MKTLRSRLRRHLTYANVMASIAVFVALGGVGYAATTISGNKIIKGTVGAGKLKNGTLTSAQVKANSLTGSVINESTLGTVPAAQTATTAVSANTADSANMAKSATSAEHAVSAEHALSANTASQATTAGSADSAATAGDADTLNGLTAEQLQVACPAKTELFGGMCWDQDVQPANNWIAASKECGNAGGRLPSVSELIAYVFRSSPPVTGETWTSDVAGLDPGPGNGEMVFTHDEMSTAVDEASASHGYRCLFYRVN
jgi:hypothetical protein